MTVNSDKKLQQLPHKNDISNMVAAMMQVVPNFPARRTLLYGQRSLSADLSESQLLAYLWSKSMIRKFINTKLFWIIMCKLSLRLQRHVNLHNYGIG